MAGERLTAPAPRTTTASFRGEVPTSNWSKNISSKVNIRPIHVPRLGVDTRPNPYADKAVSKRQRLGDMPIVMMGERRPKKKSRSSLNPELMLQNRNRKLFSDTQNPSGERLRATKKIWSAEPLVKRIEIPSKKLEKRGTIFRYQDRPPLKQAATETAQTHIERKSRTLVARKPDILFSKPSTDIPTRAVQRETHRNFRLAKKTEQALVQAGFTEKEARLKIGKVLRSQYKQKIETLKQEKPSDRLVKKRKLRTFRSEAKRNANREADCREEKHEYIIDRRAQIEREKAAIHAFKTLSANRTKSRPLVTGATIAHHMPTPENARHTPLASMLLWQVGKPNKIDGSYRQVRSDISNLGTFTTTKDVKWNIQKILHTKPAVQKVKNIPSEVSTGDVQRVLADA